ncbi:hypothetical protein OIU74_003292 [Salix koriyanagi]|uniref:Receptor-like protein 51 n=1 Tax=Salix koriyanagi TaxID=2511006 RepID=A0A9Q0UZ27_9ROSI|nr:hypothetical protein OIU74_003292 [Salix koriyanagi]
MSPPPSPILLSLLLLFLISTTTTEAASASPTATLPPSPSPTSSPTVPSTKTPSPTTSPTPPTTKTPFPSINSTLSPKQLIALQSLDIPTSKDPCIQPSPHNATICDSSSPFRLLISLHLSNCSSDLSLSYTALKSLSTLQSLSFTNCPVTPIRFPLDLASSLHSFTCIHSLKHLTGVGLSRFVNLTDLTVSNVPVNTSGLYAVLGNMRKLRSVTISNANVTGYIPKHLLPNLTHIDFSGSNSLSGAIPDSMSAIPELAYVDMSSNQLNGTVPKFFAEMKKLKYLNLENNEFHGVLPFNLTFMKKLDVLKVGGNSNLCYNHTILSSKLKLGIAPCDKHGLPLSPPPAKDNSSGGDSESDSSDYNDEDDDSNSKKEGHHGPNKVVLGVAIALSSIVFLIVFLILLSKRCG